MPADLRDVGRLDALRQQAIKRDWITGCEADRLNFVAAAVHARRIGSAPCRLFVAIVRDQRWELITDGDEDEAQALLRERDPRPGRSPAAPTWGLSDDACVVRFVEQTLRNAGSAAEPFAVLVQHDATWTRARWDAARAELRGRSGRGWSGWGRRSEAGACGASRTLSACTQKGLAGRQREFSTGGAENAPGKSVMLGGRKAPWTSPF